MEHTILPLSPESWSRTLKRATRVSEAFSGIDFVNDEMVTSGGLSLTSNTSTKTVHV
ncbi:unnamed protein product, partial [Gulo gulo]